MTADPDTGKAARLGKVNGIACDILLTRRPWESDIDAIVVSIGSTLGSLALTLSEVFPDADWEGLPGRGVTPEEPSVLDLRAYRQRLQFAVATTPHEGGSPGEPSLGAIATATEAAVLLAAREGARALGVPLLGTWSLGMQADRVASVSVPAVMRALEQASDTQLRRVVFICRENYSVKAIRAAWEGRAVELAGGVSSDLVDPNVGIPLDRDQLDMALYVSMLATVIADRKTPLPLSVGIFGEWGSGKSYFMGLLREQVGRLADSGNRAYCDEVVQIGFNAWHYADTNLWASLGDEIFRQLAGPGPSSGERRTLLRDELAKRLEQVKELEAAKQQAQEIAARLQADVDQAGTARGITAKNLIRALTGSRKLWRHLGISDQAEQGALLVEQFRGTLTEADVLRRSWHDRWGRVALVVSGVVLLAVVLTGALAPDAWRLLSAVGAGSLALAGTGITFMTRVRAGIRELHELAEDLRDRMSRAAWADLPPEVAAQLDRLRKAEADQRVAQAQLAEVVARVGELGRQLTELAPGRNLYTFLADRAHGDSYRGKLGLVSTIRKDFEQLVELMRDWRAHPDAGGKPIDRIVLYIDDLDRCNPRQVVQVLEAVHLLLALELFVVVVGVDPRWLVRSLRSHYDEILDEGPDGGWQATPEDYLEKIINLPLVLPAMPQGGLHRLLRSLDSEHFELPPGTQQPDREEAPGFIGSVLNPGFVEPGSEVDGQREPARAPQGPDPLTDSELTLLSTLDNLVTTPRQAKRLFNLYRMVRATRHLSEASRFLGDDGKPGEYQAVVTLLGLLTAPARLLGRALDTPPDPARSVGGGLVHRHPEAAWAQFVADCEPRRAGESWHNGVAGVLGEEEVRDWFRLHRGLTHVSESVELTDVSSFQAWVPVIRRFSYVLG
ncbi:P-loop NTPase fold protein [Amycolatopsis taiwanensis]|uniref:KAP NTPase domain-containing protein n=1 Tax=Amycolatopsis taiwanensis TaxID=342230 RepID=A0A9W6R3Z3_9PSEU|nr:P-loop NTPase fold protein [Amycolatopsis taiwanensis]GLY68431.1 hypothetical protein Atai01_50500 [Amycolatopsis taiwanensis]